ncbi:MAG: O-antigen ligase family protein [Patescibacteria group bacterium]
MLTSLIVFTLILAIAIFIVWPESSLYALAFLLPAIGWYFYFGPMIIPLIDLAALLAITAFALRTAGRLIVRPQEKLSIRWPLFLPFAVFLALSALSALFSDQPLYSFWYIVRWPLFLYLAYVFLPYNLITSGRILKRTIIALVLSSFLVAINGYLSLYGQDWRDSFFRIRPLAWGGLNLFGENHNLIAEFLNVGAFLIIALRYLVKKASLQRWLDIAFALTALAIVLTFSRAGWITLAIQTIVYGWYHLRSKNNSRTSLVVALAALLLVLFPLFWKMEQLQRDNTSSTENRWLLTEIALQAYQERPYFGYGSGQFINLVDDNIRFRAKYGEAIDSHGVLQKVLAENGVFGLAAWLFLMAAWLQAGFSALKKYYQKNPWLLPLFLAGAGGLFFQLFNTSYYKGKVWLPLAIFLAAVRLLDAKYGKRERNEN